MKIPELPVAHVNRVQNRHVVKLGMVLSQVPEGAIPTYAHFTLTGGQKSRQDFDKSGFPRAVGSN